MNILPKKSWHVRTRKNIEKVRKDEAQAAEEENRRQERIRVAEREARTHFLRKKARGQTNQDDDDQSTDIFHGVNHGQGDKRINEEHCKEEKKKKEDWEQKVGILTYLHKKDSDVDSPWYLKSHEDRITSSKKNDQETNAHDMEDPLQDMKKYLKQMKPSTITKPAASSSESLKGRDRSKKEETSSTSRESKDKLEMLRHQRLKREAKEKIRQDKLLSVSGMTPRSTSRDDERTFRFNSQFNPHLSKN